MTQQIEERIRCISTKVHLKKYMNKSDLNRNKYKLKGRLARKGYDWWWHNFTGKHHSTGEEKSFYIEYFFINPELSPNKVVLGQDGRGLKPSYFMVNVGTWGEDRRQLHNFYPVGDVSIGAENLHVSVADNLLTETHIKGSCSVNENQASKTEYMSDEGSMSWDLQVDKKVAYNVGYGASDFMTKLNAFEMFWHAEGIKTEFQGYVIFNGEKYIVDKETCYGYADKNWGKDYTAPWLWLSSCHLVSRLTNKELKNSAFEVGGGTPKVLGIPLYGKSLAGIYYEGQMIDFNFTKFWKKNKVAYKFIESDGYGFWQVRAKNKNYSMKLRLKCKLDEMLKINYEAPNGKKLHNRLWNGGTGVGNLKIYDKNNFLVDDIDFYNAGCEYGEYDKGIKRDAHF